MPAATKKELYLGKSVGDLNKQADTIPKTSARLLLKTLDKLHKNAEHSELMGDDEKAYVLFMKFCFVFQAIQKSPEYKKDQTYYNNMIDKKLYVKAIDKAEDLSKNLEKRYEEKEAKEVSAKLETLRIHEEQVLKEEKRKDLQKEEKEKKEKDKKKDENNKKEQINGDNAVSDKKGITAGNLYSLLSDANPSVLIIDVRSSADFAESHLNHPSCINIPGNCISAGAVVRMIQEQMPEESLERWLIRDKVDSIVLYDWNSTSAAVAADKTSTLGSLRSAMYDFDIKVKLQSQPMVLDGGYSNWLSMYPSLTTDASVQGPEQFKVINDIPSLDNIDYDLDLTFLKTNEPQPPEPKQGFISSNTEVASNSTASKKGVPQIDRSNKPPQNNMGIHPAPLSVEGNKKPLTHKNILKETNINRSKQEKPCKPNNIQAKLSNGISAPSVDRNLKPGESVSDSYKTFSSGSMDLPNMSDVVSFEENKELSDLKAEANRLAEVAKAKQDDLEKVQTLREVALEEERAKLKQLQDLNKKTAKETADKMRLKKALEKEIEEMEIRKKEMEEEELYRKNDLEKAEKNKAEQDRRLKDVEKKRQERKQEEKQEETKRELKKKLEEEKKRENERKALELQKQKEVQAENEAKLADEKRLKDEITQRDAKMKEDERKAQYKNAIANAIANDKDLRSNPRTSSENLPPGWALEKNIMTGQMMYRDLSTNILHRALPKSFQSTTPSATHKHKLKDESNTSTLQAAGGGMKRSHSSPNIAQLGLDEDVESQPRTPVSREPSNISSRNSSIPSDVSSAKVRNMQPSWGNVNAGLTGLRNLGNTCYMNATLQCLSNTEFLIKYFVEDLYKKNINRTNVLGTRGEIAEEYAALAKAIWCGKYRSLSCRDFKSTISMKDDRFEGYEQQDAQELLMVLLDGLHEDLNRVERRVTLPEQNNDNVPDDQAAERAWLYHKKLNDSVMVDLFQGQFKSTVTCLRCRKFSVTFDAFMYLSLPIPSKSRTSLTDCIAHFYREEKITGEHRWECPRCRTKQDAVKSICIWRLPHILIIHFKRFYQQGIWRQKNSAYIDFPLYDLDLQTCVTGPKPRNSYNLYGVTNHYGTMDGGHYTAYARNPYSRRWYKYDDHEVYDLNKSDIRSSAAFILYYTSMDANRV